MAQALYRTWRPQTFEDVVGQEPIIQTLKYALRTGRIHHAYLLAGPRGTGKTTTARLIAKAVNCLAPEDQRPCNHCEICNAINDGRLMDLIEIDAASNTGVDNIRDLLEKVGFRPTQATYKVYVIDEIHMLSTQAFNALLKTLEEPPEHVIFVLATTEVHKIPETILSRCQRFEFRRIPLLEIVQQLEKIAAAETITAEREALDLIARAATGSMRDAISLFDQVAASGAITADYVRMMLGAERREVVQELLAAWVQRDLTQGLQIINRAIDGGADPRQLARQTAEFLRGLLLMRLGAGHTWLEPTSEERERLMALAQQADPDRLVDAVRRFSDVAAKQRAGWQPQLPLELAFVEAALQPEPAASTGATARAAAPITTRNAIPQPASTTKPSAPPAAAVAQPAPQTRQKQARETEAPNDEAATTPENTPEPPASSKLEPKNEPETTQVRTAIDAGLADTIRANWDDIIRQVQPVSLGALLRDANVGGCDSQGRLVLAFQHSFHRDRVAETANLRKLEAYLSQVFNQSMIVQCLLEEDWRAQASSQPAPKARKSVQRNAIPPEEDELIRRAQEELGAVIKNSNPT